MQWELMSNGAQGPLKKKNSDHYREGFNKPKVETDSHDTAGVVAVISRVAAHWLIWYPRAGLDC